MTKQEVLFLYANIGRLANLRDSKLAYAVIKNESKLKKEREVILAQLEKMRGEIAVEKFVETAEGLAILDEESGIELYKLKTTPEIEVTAAELHVLNFITEDDENDLPEGPPVKK